MKRILLFLVLFLLKPFCVFGSFKRFLPPVPKYIWTLSEKAVLDARVKQYKHIVVCFNLGGCWYDLKDVLIELSYEWSGTGVVFYEVDLFSIRASRARGTVPRMDEDLCPGYNIFYQNLPVIVYFRDGKELFRTSGCDQTRSLIDKNLKKLLSD